METLVSSRCTPAQLAADADITAAVELYFLTKKGVTAHLIDVTTRNGIVELAGATDSLRSRRRAEEIALAVRGVRGVINQLHIRCEDVPSPELNRAVEQALADDPATRDYNLRCTVASGTVWLTGTVRSWAEKQLALHIAEGVRGVRHLETGQLRICGGQPAKSDDDLTAQLRELLDWDVRLNKKLLQVTTRHGLVQLTGKVGSAAAKQRIERLAYELGASHVDSEQLTVTPWALEAELRREEDPATTDEAIGQAVRDTFRLDPRLLEVAPLVQVHDGVVTLLGIVNNLRARHCAEHDARHVVGVREVKNLLKVRNTRFWPDDDIRQRVAAALSRDPYVGPYHFKVGVQLGRVTLQGWVDNLFEQEQAYEIASGINGVVEVDNRVQVLPSGQNPALALDGALTGALAVEKLMPSDAVLAGRIRTRYFWSASLHDQPIEVQVHNGRATLTGTVATWLERQLAVREAHELGARDVNNHLRVCFTPQPTANLAAVA